MIDLLVPQWFQLVAVFAFGAIFGSFLNVVIYRLPLDRSVVFPDSACGVCGTPVRFFPDNVPILAYFLRGGRCYTCSSPFSIRYALIELFIACGAAFLWHFYPGAHARAIYCFVFLFIATAVFFTDIDHWIIPDQVSIGGAVAGCVGACWMPARNDIGALLEAVHLSLGPAGQNAISSVIGALFGYGLFMGIQIVGTIAARQEAMGGGDVKYAAGIGAFLGWKLAFVAFLLSFLLGAAWAVPMLLLRRGQGKDPIPFGTFMALAAVPTALWGGPMLEFLLRLPDYLPARFLAPV